MSHTRNEIILSVEGVGITYDRPILRDVSLQIHNLSRPGVRQGQVVSLIGRSGIGKTQLFKIIAGMLKPTTGTVRIGLDLHPVIAGEVGIVPQNYLLFRHRTVMQNLSIAMERSDAKHTEAQQKDVIMQHAEQFQLSEHLEKYPAQLSGGQRQRVSILQQVLTGTKTILFDEPFSGLDVLMIDKVIELLLKVSLLDEHNTLIIVSHDVENAMAISDTVFILASQEGKPGATMTETIDLVGMGLAWDEDIKENARFRELVEQIKHKI
jgi:ABC-type nitrate/sulfonate/bicarbonate transport system ATPase subunit